MQHDQEFYISVAVYMTPQGDEEFKIAVIIWGAIWMLGGLGVIILTAIALKYKLFLKKKTIIKELYDEKERQNGQEKGGSRCHY